MRSYIIIRLTATVVLLAAHLGCKALPPDADQPNQLESTPKTLLFVTVPFDYLSDHAQDIAEMGVGGVMVAGIMYSAYSDVWALDDRSRIVGSDNPKLKRLQEMNRVCREHSIEDNFVKVALYENFPDWFDDGAWEPIIENFRQVAVFARMSSFKGIAFDAEYINATYLLDWPGYQGPNYPKKKLPAAVRLRGRQIVTAMLDEYPSMTLLHFPESHWRYGPLAGELLAGQLEAMAEREAPGGFHILPEGTYRQADPQTLLQIVQQTDIMFEDLIDDGVSEYWRQYGSISPGLWPLGYYESVTNTAGDHVRYRGRTRVFDNDEGSYGDKSSQFSSEVFRNLFGTSLLVASRYVWIYCHGSVFWQMTATERERYGGSKNDLLPLDDNIDEFVSVMTERSVPTDTTIVNRARLIRQGHRADFQDVTGAPDLWRIVGPFDDSSEGLNTSHWPERTSQTDSFDSTWSLIAVRPVRTVYISSLLGTRENISAYLRVNVTSPQARDAVVRVGSDDGVIIWADGVQVWKNVTRGAIAEEHDSFDISLKEGTTPILVKSHNIDGRWTFTFRITDRGGLPVEGLKYSLPRT